MQRQILLFFLSLIAINLISSQRLGKKEVGYIKYSVSLDSVLFRKGIEKVKDQNVDIYDFLSESWLAAFDISNNSKIELYFSTYESMSFIDMERVVQLSLENQYVQESAISNIDSEFARYYLNSKNRTRIKEILDIDQNSFIHLVDAWNPYQWKLVDSTKKLGKFNCKKAVGVLVTDSYCCGTVISNIEAWYSPELPYPYGPLAFNGLPGIVLEVTIENEDMSRTFQANQILIRKKKHALKAVPVLNKPARTTTEEQLNKEALEFIETIKGGN